MESQVNVVNGYEIKPFANLINANLAYADLRRAKLEFGALIGANLRGAYLKGARFKNTTIFSGVTCNKAPLAIDHLTYPVLITETHIQIGCQVHSHLQWESFTPEDILRMDKKAAYKFWEESKQVLLTVCKFQAARVNQNHE